MRVEVERIAGSPIEMFAKQFLIDKSVSTRTFHIFHAEVILAETLPRKGERAQEHHLIVRYILARTSEARLQQFAQYHLLRTYYICLSMMRLKSVRTRVRKGESERRTMARGFLMFAKHTDAGLISGFLMWSPPLTPPPTPTAFSLSLVEGLVLVNVPYVQLAR